MENIQTYLQPSLLARLEASVIHLDTLREALKEEHHWQSKVSLKFTQLNEMFEAEVKKLANLKEDMKTTLNLALQAKGEAILETLAKKTAEALLAQGEKVAKDLERTVHQAQSLLNAYQQQDQKSQWVWSAKLFGVTLLTSLVVSLIVAWCMVPKYEPTETQKKYIQNGQTLERIWPKLTKKEKLRLEKLSK